MFWKSSKSHASSESESEDTQKLVKFFSETKGEIYLSEATCITYTMDISRKVPLDFTEDFKSILKGMQVAASNPENTELRSNVFRRFVHDFGTHYLSKIDMGAKISIETRFSSRAESTAEVARRMNCIAKSQSSSSSSSLETPEIELKVEEGPISGSTKIQHLNIGSSSGESSASNR